MIERMVWPPHDVMVARNDELIAERFNWPDGVLEEVRALRKAHPGWGITWAQGAIGAWREDGYYAWVVNGWPRRRFVYRATAVELGAVLELAPYPSRDWTPPGGWLPLTA